jgi:hypothetical protein
MLGRPVLDYAESYDDDEFEGSMLFIILILIYIFKLKNTDNM